MPAGLSLVSYDKAAFESYYLDGAANAGIGYRAADGYLRALTALGQDKLRGRPKTSLKVGNTLFLFWTRDPIDSSDLMQLDQPTPDEVARLMQSPERGHVAHVQPNQFYCLALSANAARAVVRDYLEAPLPEVRVNIGQWFRDLRIADASFQGQGRVTATFPLWMLASATGRESDDVARQLPAQLMHAALKRARLPDAVLAACICRLRAESGPLQFRPARLALIKACLNRNLYRGEQPMTETLDTHRIHDPPYVCGRLLAFLARCQSPRDFGTSAPLLERFFGSASTAPRSVFPTLLRLNRHHLAIRRDENPGFAFNLEAELDELLFPLKHAGDGPPDFPPILSLREQGRFALGFYHQRAEYRRQSAERKASESQA